MHHNSSKLAIAFIWIAVFLFVATGCSLLLTCCSMAEFYGRWVDLSLDLIPWISQGKDALTMATGRNPITGEDYSILERGVLLFFLALPWFHGNLFQSLLSNPNATPQTGFLKKQIFHCWEALKENFIYCVLCWSVFFFTDHWQALTSTASIQSAASLPTLKKALFKTKKNRPVYWLESAWHLRQAKWKTSLWYTLPLRAYALGLAGIYVGYALESPQPYPSAQQLSTMHWGELLIEDRLRYPHKS